MDQAYAAPEDALDVQANWQFETNLGRKSKEQDILDEKSELRQQQQLLEYEKQEFLRAKAFEEKRLAKEKKIFDMEWKMLEEGWRKLAVEREEVERMRSPKSGEEDDVSFHFSDDVSVSLLFHGVTNMRLLKKRYKDLMKIFHPDNAAGDIEVVQKINQEYDSLQKSLKRV